LFLTIISVSGLFNGIHLLRRPVSPFPDDSSESDHYSPVPYGELDALRFHAELEAAQRELEDVSKKAGVAELEWEDQRKQLLATIDGTAHETAP
jgi:hypothetical protein